MEKEGGENKPYGLGDLILGHPTVEERIDYDALNFGNTELEELTPEEVDAWWSNKIKANIIVALLDPHQLQENHTLAYAVSILHKYLQESFFEADEVRSESLKKHYLKQTKTQILNCVLNQRGGLLCQFSQEEEGKIRELGEQFRANAQELAGVFKEGEDVRPQLSARLPIAVGLLYSSLEQFLNSLPPIPVRLKGGISDRGERAKP